MSLLKPLRAIQINRSHPLARGLVGCWLFNERSGSIFLDSSGMKNNFDIGNGSPEWSNSKYGGGLLFNSGSGEYLQYSSAILTQLPISVVGWAKSDNIDTDNVILDIGYSGAEAGNILLGMLGSWSGNPVAAFIRDTDWSGGAAVTTKAFSAGIWHQCVAVFVSNSKRRVYIDGANEGTNATVCAVPPVNRTHIGATADSTPGAYMSGIIDHVMLYNRVLSAREVAWLYREPFAMFDDIGPVSVHVPVTVVYLAGAVSAQSTTKGQLTSCCRLPELERFWIFDALFNGMTANAFKLGTVLTMGWFWVRVNGCAALYRGESITQIDFENILTVSEPEATEIKPPTYIPHDNDSVYFYLVCRFNSCGLQERTLSAAVKVSIQSDGSLKEPHPNKIFNVRAQQTDDNNVRLVWFYCPLEQKSPPVCFRIYSDNASGQIDFENPVATIAYRGRKFYSYVSSELAAGQYLFAVRAKSADGSEDESQAQLKIQINTQNPKPIDILEMDVI